jgi:hypothetical protein
VALLASSDNQRPEEAHLMKKFVVAALALLCLAVATAPSLAAPAQRVPLPDLTFLAPNPCTGNMATTTLSNRELVIHDDVDPTGRQHLSATMTGDVADSEGFSGRFTITWGQNVQGPLIVGEFRGLSPIGNATLTLHDGSGRLLLVHVVSHVTVPAGPTGTLTGEVDIFKVECLGKPN